MRKIEGEHSADGATGSGGDRKRRRLGRAWRVAAWCALGLVVLLGVCVGVLVARPGLVGPLAVNAARSAGMELSFGDMELGFSPLRLTARDVFLDTAPGSTARGGTRARLRLPALTLAVAPGLWPGGAWLAELELVSPVADVLLADGGDDSGSGDNAWWRGLGALGRVRVTDARVRVAAPWGVASLTEFDAEVGASGGESGERSFSVRGRTGFDTAGAGAELVAHAVLSARGVMDERGGVTAEVETREGRLDGEAGEGFFSSDATLSLGGDNLDITRFRVQGRDVTLRPVEGVTLGDLLLRMEGAGTWDFASGGFSLSRFVFDAGDRLRLVGACSGGSGGMRRIAASGRFGDVGRIAGDVRAILPREFTDIAPDGVAEFSVLWEDGIWSAEARPEELRVRWPRYAADVKVGGTLSVASEESGALSLGGDLTVAGRGGIGDWAIKGAAMHAALSGTPEAPVAAPLKLDIGAGGVLRGGKALPLQALSVSGDVSFLPNGAVDVSDVEVREERLGALRGAFRWDPRGLARSRGEVRGAALGLETLRNVLDDFGVLPSSVPPLTGDAALSARLFRSGGKPRLAVDIGVTEAGFATQDGAWLADKVGATLSASATLDAPHSVQASVQAVSGELLLGTVYLDLSKTPLGVDAEAAVVDEQGVRGARGRAALGDLVGVRLERAVAGKLADAWQWSASGRVEHASLPGLLRTFVQDPLAFSRPELGQLELDGSLGLELAAKGEGDAVQVAGRLDLGGVRALYPAAGLAVEGLDLKLPLAYRFGATAVSSETAATAPDADPVAKAPVREHASIQDMGTLSVAGLTLPTGEVRDLSVAVGLVPNRLVVDGALPVPLAGGTLRLFGIRVDEPLSRAFRAVCSASMTDGDLSEFGTPAVPLEGTVRVDLPRIVMTYEALAAQGAVTGELFGGTYRLSGFSAKKPLADSRVAGCDEAVLTGLDLERLSTALGIGRITGLLDGEVRGFRMAYGQPQAFIMEVRSREEDGVPQKVSLKAVNTISVVGTGSGLTDIGVGMFASFFREFGYEALGIRCALTNDVFRVRGLIRDGGVEYLIKKPALFGINVINGNPDNRISFSDMMERVRRVLDDARMGPPRPPDLTGTPKPSEEP